MAKTTWETALDYLRDPSSVPGGWGRGNALVRGGQSVFFPKGWHRNFLIPGDGKVAVCLQYDNGNGWDNYGSVFLAADGTPMRTHPMDLYNAYVRRDKPSTTHFWRSRPLNEEPQANAWGRFHCHWDNPGYSRMRDAGVTIDPWDLYTLESDEELTDLSQQIWNWILEGGFEERDRKTFYVNGKQMDAFILDTSMAQTARNKPDAFSLKRTKQEEQAIKDRLLLDTSYGPHNWTVYRFHIAGIEFIIQPGADWLELPAGTQHTENPDGSVTFLKPPDGSSCIRQAYERAGIPWNGGTLSPQEIQEIIQRQSEVNCNT